MSYLPSAFLLVGLGMLIGLATSTSAIFTIIFNLRTEVDLLFFNSDSDHVSAFIYFDFSAGIS
jgi:hypothetical protein